MFPGRFLQPGPGFPAAPQDAPSAPPDNASPDGENHRDARPGTCRHNIYRSVTWPILVSILLPIDGTEGLPPPALPEPF